MVSYIQWIVKGLEKFKTKFSNVIIIHRIYYSTKENYSMPDLSEANYIQVSNDNTFLTHWQQVQLYQE